VGGGRSERIRRFFPELRPGGVPDGMVSRLLLADMMRHTYTIDE